MRNEPPTVMTLVAIGSVDRVDVVRDAADDVAGLVTVKITHRQFGKPVEYIFTHSPNDLLAEFDHQNGKNIRKKGRERIKQD